MNDRPRTLQTTEPIEHTNFSPVYRGAYHLARKEDVDFDPPYQRGHVWTPLQRINLIRSLMKGLPTGPIILADRSTHRWTDAHDGVEAYDAGIPVYAPIDGKQRLTTMRHWYSSEFPVPRSWFKPEHVTPGLSRRPEEHASGIPANDGEYIYYSDLTETGKRIFNNRARLEVSEYPSATEAEEAELYRLVNTSGTPHTDADIARAAH